MIKNSADRKNFHAPKKMKEKLVTVVKEMANLSEQKNNSKNSLV